jgi:hypothetical protein
MKITLIIENEGRTTTAEITANEARDEGRVDVNGSVEDFTTALETLSNIFMFASFDHVELVSIIEDADTGIDPLGR